MKKMFNLVAIMLICTLVFACVSMPAMAADTVSAYDAEFAENHAKLFEIVRESDKAMIGGFVLDKHQWNCAYPLPGKTDMGYVFPFGKNTNTTNLGRIMFKTGTWGGWSSNSVAAIKDNGYVKLNLYIEAGNDDGGSAVAKQINPIDFFFMDVEKYIASDKYSVSGLATNKWNSVYIPMSKFNIAAKGLNLSKLEGFDFITTKVSNVENYNICIGGLGFYYPRNMFLNEVAISGGKVTLSWENNLAADKGAAGYRIYRDGNVIETISNTTILTYVDTSAANDDMHEYYVEAVNAEGTALATTNKRYPIVYNEDTLAKISVYTNKATGLMNPKWVTNVDRRPTIVSKSDEYMAVPEGENAICMNFKGTGVVNSQNLSSDTPISIADIDDSGYLALKVYVDTTTYSQWQNPVDTWTISLINADWQGSAYNIPGSELEANKWQYIKIPMSAYADFDSIREIAFYTNEDGGYLYKLFVQDIAFIIPRINCERTMITDMEFEPVSKVEKGKEYIASMIAYNHGDVDVTPTFIAALYKDDVLVEATLVNDETVEANDEWTFMKMFTVPNDDGNYEIKTFLWDFSDNLSPYPYVK